MKKILVLMLAFASMQLVAMEQDDQPEFRRTAPRAEEIVLINALQNKNYQAASALLNTIKTPPATAIGLLKNPEIAAQINREAFKHKHIRTINVLISTDALSKEQVQKVFAEFVRNLNSEQNQKYMLTFLNSDARKIIDLNQQVDRKIEGQPLATALVLASRMLLPDLIQALLAAGANPNAQDSSGETPLMAAISSSRTVDKEKIVVMLLEQKGIDLNLKDRDGLTALMWAAIKGGNDTIADSLLQKGANINAVDAEGRTALMHALQRSSTSVALLLLKQGADITIKDKNGKTAFDYAQEGQYP